MKGKLSFNFYTDFVKKFDRNIDQINHLKILKECLANVPGTLSFTQPKPLFLSCKTSKKRKPSLRRTKLSLLDLGQFTTFQEIRIKAHNYSIDLKSSFRSTRSQMLSLFQLSTNSLWLISRKETSRDNFMRMHFNIWFILLLNKSKKKKRFNCWLTWAWLFWPLLKSTTSQNCSNSHFWRI